MVVMEPIRILAFHQTYTCEQGHTLDVWIRPRSPGVKVEPLLHCPHCGTLFVLTTTTQHPTAIRTALDRTDDRCPTCQAPLSHTRPYPEQPDCRRCADKLRAWVNCGPDLPASAATVIRGWALHDPTIDLTSVALPQPREPAAHPQDRHQPDARRPSTTATTARHPTNQTVQFDT